MWEIFKSKKRKEREAAEKEIELANLLRLKQDYNDTLSLLNKKIDMESVENSKRAKKSADITNGTCSKCKSKIFVDKISKLKGQVNGSMYGSSSIFGGYTSGYLRGSIDTHEINKCNDCGNEWKKVKSYDLDYTPSLDRRIHQVIYILNNFHEAENCSFDKYDLKEKYLSIEDKKSSLIKEAKKHFYTKDAYNFFSGTRIDVFKEMVNNLDDYYIEKFKKYMNEDILVEHLGFIK
jgi:hypothetical protein